MLPKTKGESWIKVKKVIYYIIWLFDHILSCFGQMDGLTILTFPTNLFKIIFYLLKNQYKRVFCLIIMVDISLLVYYRNTFLGDVIIGLFIYGGLTTLLIIVLLWIFSNNFRKQNQSSNSITTPTTSKS